MATAIIHNLARVVVLRYHLAERRTSIRSKPMGFSSGLKHVLLKIEVVVIYFPPLRFSRSRYVNCCVIILHNVEAERLRYSFAWVSSCSTAGLAKHVCNIWIC